MKGHIFIVIQMALIFLIFSFFLPVALPLLPARPGWQGDIIVVTGVTTLQASARADQAGSETSRGESPPTGRMAGSPAPTGGGAPTTPAGPYGQPVGAGGQADQERLRKAAASYVKLLLLTTVLLLFTFIFVMVAILLRRRRVLGRKRPEPTVLKDLWTIDEEQE